MAIIAIAPASPSSTLLLLSAPRTRACSSPSKVFVQAASPSCSSSDEFHKRSSSDPSLPHSLSYQVSRRSFCVPFSFTFAVFFSLGFQGRAEEARANDNDAKNESSEDASNVLNGIQSFFNPTEVTKTGKRLPKTYVQSAREVVRTLRESLKEDSKNEEKFRRSGDSAKEAIRVYLSSWRDSKDFATDESFQALTRVLRALGKFYITSGPRAALPDDIKTSLLEDLDKADAAL